jgi:hypothetical protein
MLMIAKFEWNKMNFFAVGECYHALLKKLVLTGNVGYANLTVASSFYIQLSLREASTDTFLEL